MEESKFQSWVYCNLSSSSGKRGLKSWDVSMWCEIISHNACSIMLDSVVFVKKSSYVYERHILSEIVMYPSKSTFKWNCTRKSEIKYLHSSAQYRSLNIYVFINCCGRLEKQVQMTILRKENINIMTLILFHSGQFGGSN